jgi:hypothetical protein
MDDGDRHERWLFDLANDPGEKSNLLTDRSANADRLKSLLVQWEQDIRPRR